MDTQQKELDLLEEIYHQGTLPQRDLARIIGLSLGMTNSILKRLSRKGYLMIKKVNNRNIRYAITPQGMEEIAKRSYRYFKRTIKNVVDYKENIDALIRSVKSQGYTAMCLIGASDLDFVVEHLCSIHALKLERLSVRRLPELTGPWPAHCFPVVAETVEPDQIDLDCKWRHLREVLLRSNQHE